MRTRAAGDQGVARERLARNPVAIECARAAAAFVGAEAEVVVFHDDHVFVAASSTAHGTMFPRPCNAAEAALQVDASDGLVLRGEWASVAIRDSAGNVVAALSTHLAGRALPADGLHTLARLVQRELLVEEDLRTDQAFFREVVHGQRDAVIVLGTDMEIRWASQGIGSLLGRTKQEIVGRSAADFLHPDDLVTTLDAINRMAAGLEMYRVYLRVLNANNEYIPVEITGTDLTANPVVEGMVLSLRDAQRDSEMGLAMQRTQRVSDAIVGGLRDGVVATDQYGTITAINGMARVMFDIDAAVPPAVLTKADFGLVTLDGRARDVFATNSTADAVCCRISSEGDLRYITTSCQPIDDADGSPLGTVVVFSDITTEHRAAEDLRQQALHDQLTGLPNRRQLEQRLADLTGRVPSTNVAACFFDLDGFKVVNDTHGHRTGDKLVRVAAERLATQLGSEVLLVRQGGDEFVALLVGVEHLDDAVVIADQCRGVLAEPYMIGDQRFDITGSVGVAMASSELLDADELLQYADLALYAAKDRGRNRVECFDDALAAAVTNEEQQRRMLREALEEDRLVMYFQPLIDTKSEMSVGYEALARIRTIDGDILSPSAFLDGIASTSLMWDLDRAAFVLSCQAAALLNKIDGDTVPYVACNFSSVSINHPDFIDFLDATVAGAGISATNISIELTESAAFEANSSGGHALAELAGRGFRLALDDFGTGYSSLSHIRDLPITSIKVDRSFIAKLERRNSERSIAGAVVNLARDLNIGVVAEGVETKEQLKHAQTLGFGTIQGWHYSRALPLTECLQDWTGARPHRRG